MQVSDEVLQHPQICATGCEIIHQGSGTGCVCGCLPEIEAVQVHGSKIDVDAHTTHDGERLSASVQLETAWLSRADQPLSNRLLGFFMIDFGLGGSLIDSA
jgi:hypothetical protein